ncbi:MAG: cell wall hydrolase [bacterium]
MLRIQTLLQGFYHTVKKSLSKKMYKQCAIITAGTIILAVVALNSKDYNGAGKNNVTANLSVVTDIDDVDEEEDNETKILTELDSQGEALESLSYSVSEEVQPTLQKAEKEVKDKITFLTQEMEQQEDNVQDQLLQISQEDYEALLKIVEAEATQEDIKGKILVANVILNRVESDNFPNNIYDVIHDKVGGTQFSPISDGRYYTVEITDSTRLAVEKALKGEDYSEGALFFVARAMASNGAVSWFDKNLTKIKQYGVHEFYKY